jgi:uncharacterized protein
MNQDRFHPEEAKQYLHKKDQQDKAIREKNRKLILNKTILTLRQLFQDTPVEVYLVGSIIRPFQFSAHSDIDIVVKNFHGDRFDLWTKIEDLVGRNVEIILFETCHFQEFVLKEGMKIV